MRPAASLTFRNDLGAVSTCISATAANLSGDALASCSRSGDLRPGASPASGSYDRRPRRPTSPSGSIGRATEPARVLTPTVGSAPPSMLSPERSENSSSTSDGEIMSLEKREERMVREPPAAASSSRRPRSLSLARRVGTERPDSSRSRKA